MMQDDDGPVIETGPNETAAPNGTTIDTDVGPAAVEQGPRWLAELLYAPPEWAVWLGRGAILLVLLGVAYLAYRVVPDLDEDERRELAIEYVEMALVIGCVVGGTVAFSRYAGLAYWIDVLGGSTLGFACSQAILRGLPRPLPGEDAAMAPSNKH